MMKTPTHITSLQYPLLLPKPYTLLVPLVTNIVKDQIISFLIFAQKFSVVILHSRANCRLRTVPTRFTKTSMEATHCGQDGIS